MTLYRITIEQGEEEVATRVLKFYNKNWDWTESLDTEGKLPNALGIEVELSKYELLYFRISCPVRNIMDMTARREYMKEVST